MRVSSTENSSFFNGLEELSTGRSNHVLKVETSLNKLSNGSLLCTESVIVFARLIHVEVEDFLLDHLWVFSFKRIALVKYEEYAASKCPNVNLFAEAALL